jgi:hypothetical protein
VLTVDQPAIGAQELKMIHLECGDGARHGNSSFLTWLFERVVIGLCCCPASDFSIRGDRLTGPRALYAPGTLALNCGAILPENKRSRASS